MNEEELIQETRRLISRWDSVRVVGLGWSGDPRRGFQFNPTDVRTGGGGSSGGTPPPPTTSGACCPTSGDCFIATQAICEAGGGTYQGDDTLCVPDPCPSTGGGCYRFTFSADNVGSCFTLGGGGDCTGSVPFTFTTTFTTDDTCSTLNLNDSGTGDGGFGPYDWYVYAVDTGGGLYDLFYGFSWSGFTACGVSDTISLDLVQSGLTCNVDQSFVDHPTVCGASGGACSSVGCPGPVQNLLDFSAVLGSSATATIAYECCPCCNGGTCTDLPPDDCTASGGTCDAGGTTCADASGACCAFGTCFDDVVESVCTDIFGGTFKGACSTCTPDPC